MLHMMPGGFLNCQGTDDLTTAIAVGYDATMSCVLRSGILLALVVMLPACASKTAVPRPFPGAPSSPTARVPPPVTEPGPVALLETALSYRGVPYRNGGSDPAGFDCSGFVQWVFAQHGLRLPREVRDQYQTGSTIDRDAVQPGDLVFFETVSRGASHVGIALGGSTFVHAPSSRGVVRVESYTSEYWKQRYVGARRMP
ncbi:MAG TPA: NlpC/P60 family protein [Hyalangium sp.]|nr:NlpC/P60 family protein [Hyalangium sp.]